MRLAGFGRATAARFLGQHQIRRVTTRPGPASAPADCKKKLGNEEAYDA